MCDELLDQPMPGHSFAPLTGRVDLFTIDSELLKNRLEDPTCREITVHVSSEAINLMEQGHELPAIIYLAPFTSSGPARAGWKAFSESLLQRHERLVSTKEMPPCILVMPDTFTTLGGNQFVDSAVLGNWSTWLVEALKPAIMERYSCNGKFGLVGKSSGGYGAIFNALSKPGEWGAVASHSGDVGFEVMFMPTFAETLTHISQYGSPADYVQSIRQANSMGSSDFHTLMICAMAASYDPIDPTNANPLGIRLPVDLQSCQLKEEAWANWLKFDPLILLESNFKNLKSLEVLFIDCGNKDQYGIQYGSRRMNERLTELGVEHILQEFEGTHSGIDYRLDISLPLLSKSLSD
jgi:hypothetical protein